MLAKLFVASKDVYNLIDKYLNKYDKQVVFMTICKYDLIDWISVDNTYEYPPTDEKYLKEYYSELYHRREKHILYSGEFLKKSIWSTLDFSIHCAKHNYVNLLKYWYNFHVRNKKVCLWSAKTIETSVIYGNLEILQYAHSELCRYHNNIVEYTVGGFKYNSINVLEWLCENNFNLSDYAYLEAGYCGNIEMVECLIKDIKKIKYNQNNIYDCFYNLVSGAVNGDQPELLEYLINHDTHYFRDLVLDDEMYETFCEEAVVSENLDMIKLLCKTKGTIHINILRYIPNFTNRELLDWFHEIGCL